MNNLLKKLKAMSDELPDSVFDDSLPKAPLPIDLYYSLIIGMFKENCDVLKSKLEERPIVNIPQCKERVDFMLKVYKDHEEWLLRKQNTKPFGLKP